MGELYRVDILGMKQKKRKKFPFEELLFPIIILLILNITFIASQDTRLKRLGKYIFYTAKSAIARELSVKLDVPYHRQEHALSCEIASLKMILNYYNVKVSESELLQLLPFDTRMPRSKNNIWGDPNKGFVGNIDGKIPDVGYGVYEKPIYDLAYKFDRSAVILTPSTLNGILTEVEAGHPVIVWGTLSSGKDISWMTREGQKIKAIYGEHTRVVIGFEGKKDNPKKILMLDPVYGEITMSKQKFLSNWELLGNKALVIY